MKERPILFSGPMVRAILDGSKTQTRRVAKPDGKYRLDLVCPADGGPSKCPHGQPGDRLWSRETYYAWGHWTKRYSYEKRREEWHFVDETIGAGLTYRYEADQKLPRRQRQLHEVGWYKRPAIFMPREACRLVLEITSVRVERLQDISQTDAISEGILSVRTDDWDAQHFPEWEAASNAARLAGTKPPLGPSPKESFSKLWESINGSESWPANPWVWVIEFKRIKP